MARYQQSPACSRARKAVGYIFDVLYGTIKQGMSEASFEKVDFTTQAKALIGFGIIDLLDILKNNVNEDSYRYELSKVMQLIEPSQLGDRFKMARFQKGMK